MIPTAENDEQKEILTKEIDYFEYLHQQLKIGAEKKIENNLQQKVHTIGSIVDNFLLDNFMGFEVDYTFCFENLYILRALGLLDDFNQMQKGDKKHIKTSVVEVEINRRSSSGFSLSLLSDENLSDKKQAIIEELKQGDFWKIFTQLIKVHQPGTTTSYTEQTFKLSDNLLLNAVYLARLDFLPRGYSLNYPLGEQSFADWTKEILLFACQKRVCFNDDGAVEKITFVLDDGIELILLPAIDSVVNINNLLDVDWQLAISSLLEPNMLEVANQSDDSRCEAFIDRATGKTLIEALEFAKLKFSRDFESFLTGDEQFNFRDRFGGPYTHISRLLAKILWSGDMGKIETIFVNQNNEMPIVEELRLLAEYPNQDNAVCALQSILLQLLDKDENDRTSDIATTSETIGVSDGACFDVTSYYCQALQCGNLYLKIINDKQFLIKTHGHHTLINLTPIWFNGIELPKGCLFTTVNNDEFAFLRLTPFMFDNRADMVSAFGTEIIKAEDIGEDPLKIINHDWHYNWF